MPICGICDFRVEVVAECGGDCEMQCCGACLSPSSLCPECEAEEAKGIWCPPAPTVALLLSGATIGGERLPVVGEKADA